MKMRELVEDWLWQARKYDQREVNATKRKELIIAAQQAGLAVAFRVCANDLIRVLETR